MLSPRACSAQDLVLAFTGLNPAAISLVAEKVSLSLQGTPLFSAARVPVSIAGFGPHRPGNCTDCLRQVFGTQHVSAVGRGSAARADFMHLKSPPARIPAAKKILKSGWTVDIRCPLPLGSGVD